MWQRFYKLPLYLKFLVLLLPILVVSTSALSLFFYLHLKDRVYYSSWQRLELFSQFLSTTRARKALVPEVQKKYSDLIFERMSPIL
jgi:hypothetical protein